jgi:hypothetical protein
LNPTAQLQYRSEHGALASIKLFAAHTSTARQRLEYSCCYANARTADPEQTPNRDFEQLSNCSSTLRSLQPAHIALAHDCEGAYSETPAAAGNTLGNKSVNVSLEST